MWVSSTNNSWAHPSPAHPTSFLSPCEGSLAAHIYLLPIDVATHSGHVPALHILLFTLLCTSLGNFLNVFCSLLCKHLGTGFQQGTCTSWLFHYFALLPCKLSRLAGVEAKRRKTKTGETGIHSIWMFSREQGVNAGLSPHTGVMSQGQTDAVKEGIQETFPH